VGEFTQFAVMDDIIVEQFYSLLHLCTGYTVWFGAVSVNSKPLNEVKVMYPLESAVQNMAKSSVPGSVAAAKPVTFRKPT